MDEPCAKAADTKKTEFRLLPCESERYLFGAAPPQTKIKQLKETKKNLKVKGKRDSLEYVH